MTGYYVRIKRDGKWQAIEMEYLTNTEREEFFKDCDKAEVLKWLNAFCAAVKGIKSECFNATKH